LVTFLTGSRATPARMRKSTTRKPRHLIDSDSRPESLARLPDCSKVRPRKASVRDMPLYPRSAAPGESPVPRAPSPRRRGSEGPRQCRQADEGAISPAPNRRRKTRMPSAFAAMMKKVVRKGALKLTSASGDTHISGDGSESTIAIRFADAEAETAA